MSVPQRMCIGCRQKLDQSELIRVINCNGEAVVAPDKYTTGRSAYFHKNSKCLQIAVKKRSLPRALKCEISDGVYERIEKIINGS